MTETTKINLSVIKLGILVPKVFIDFSSSAPNTSRHIATHVHCFAALSQLCHAEKNLGKPLGPG